MHVLMARNLDCVAITRIGVTNHSHAGVVGENALKLLGSEIGAIGNRNLTGVNRATDAYAAAVVNRDP